MTEIKKKQVAFPVGLKVVDVRWMTKEEMEQECWDYHPMNANPVLVFEDGSIVYASSDAEGNDPGMLFGCTDQNEQCYIVPLSDIQQNN